MLSEAKHDSVLIFVDCKTSMPSISTRASIDADPTMHVASLRSFDRSLIARPIFPLHV